MSPRWSWSICLFIYLYPRAIVDPPSSIGGVVSPPGLAGDVQPPNPSCLAGDVQPCQGRRGNTKQQTVGNNKGLLPAILAHAVAASEGDEPGTALDIAEGVISTMLAQGHETVSTMTRLVMLLLLRCRNLL